MKAAPSGRGFLVGSRSQAELASPQVVVEVAAAGEIITPETEMAEMATVMATVIMGMAAHRLQQPLTCLTYPLSPA